MIFPSVATDLCQYTIKLLKQWQSDKHIDKSNFKNMENYSLIMRFKIMHKQSFSYLSNVQVFELNLRQDFKIRLLY